jgi:hypothetical protein
MTPPGLGVVILFSDCALVMSRLRSSAGASAFDIDITACVWKHHRDNLELALFCGDRKNGGKRQSSLPDTLDARVRNASSSHPSEPSRKNKRILVDDKKALECKPTHNRKQPENDSSEAKP